MGLTIDQGRDIVGYARAVIEGHFSGKKPKPPESLKADFGQKRGVFVTLHDNGDLRGCIGYPEPTLPLGIAVERAALSAATEDPRFPQVQEQEMGHIVVEVSVLTAPQLVEVSEPGDYPMKIVIGRDGLIAELGWGRGLLLPQVPVEWNWEPLEFLRHTCSKAGLPLDAWKEKGFKLYSFSAQVFSEEGPMGEVTERKIS